MFTPKCHKKPLSATAQLLLRLKYFDETKHTSHHPWCGDDAYALGRGVIKPQAMVGAKAALGHGGTGVPQ